MENVLASLKKQKEETRYKNLKSRKIISSNLLLYFVEVALSWTLLLYPTQFKGNIFIITDICTLTSLKLNIKNSRTSYYDQPDSWQQQCRNEML